jgi:DNA-binding phage protein
MADIAKEAGISRERVRQWVMLVYGTTEKSRPTLKCGTEVKKAIELKKQFKELPVNKIEHIGGRNRN